MPELVRALALQSFCDDVSHRRAGYLLQDARKHQADRDDGTDQQAERGQSAFAGEAAVAHGCSLAGIPRVYSGHPATWWDTDLIAGESFRDRIVQEIKTCKAAIVIWTSDSVRSDYVVSEAERARIAGKLIQLRTADVEPTDFTAPC